MAMRVLLLKAKPQPTQQLLLFGSDLSPEWREQDHPRTMIGIHGGQFAEKPKPVEPAAPAPRAPMAPPSDLALNPINGMLERRERRYSGDPDQVTERYSDLDAYRYAHPSEHDEEGIYRIPAWSLDSARDSMAKIDKQAKKLGVAPPSLEVVGRYEFLRKDRDGYDVWRKYVAVRVAGERPKLGDWRLVGVLDHSHEAGIVTRALPGEKVPETFRAVEKACDHCHKRRNRTDTFVVASEETGQFKQVGRDCMKDFTGHQSPEQVIRYMEMLDSICRDFGGGGDDEDDYGRERGGHRAPRTYDTGSFLAEAAIAIRTGGWVSSQMAREDGRQSTKAAAERAYAEHSGWVKPEKDSSGRPRPLPSPEPRDREYADTALAWLHGKGEEWYKGNDYRHNLWNTCHSTDLVARDLGIAASLLGAYKREQDELHAASQDPAQKVEKKDGDALGKEGERGEWVLTVDGSRELDSDYGVTFLYKFSDPEGRKACWFASSEALEDYKTYHLRGTVKRVQDREFKGKTYRETQLTRCTVLAEVEPGFQVPEKPAKKARAKKEPTTTARTCPDCQQTLRQKDRAIDHGVASDLCRPCHAKRCAACGRPRPLRDGTCDQCRRHLG